MSLLKEIQNQSLNTRKLMFGLALIATLAFIGRIWFESFQNNLYAVLNPEEVVETRNLAEQEGDGFFASIKGSFSSLSALVNDAFSDGNVVNIENEPTRAPLVEESYKPLPLSPER